MKKRGTLRSAHSASFAARFIRGNQIQGPRRKCAGQLAQLEAFISLRSNLGKDLTIERHAASE
jgi:hypothetical protein